MTTIVDTSAWSLAFRRRASATLSVDEQQILATVASLSVSGEAVLIGPIRQELLSGIRTAEQFERVRRQIAGFTLLDLEAHTFDLAASYANRCRGAGVAASDIDMMICAAAVEYAAPILTLDADFARYATVLPITLA